MSKHSYTSNSEEVGGQRANNILVIGQKFLVTFVYKSKKVIAIKCYHTILQFTHWE